MVLVYSRSKIAPVRSRVRELWLIRRTLIVLLESIEIVIVRNPNDVSMDPVAAIMSAFPNDLRLRRKQSQFPCSLWFINRVTISKLLHVQMVHVCQLLAHVLLYNVVLRIVHSVVGMVHAHRMERNVLKKTACQATFKRCEDGSCRKQCLHYDGCSLQKPYHCPNRECAEDSSKCLLKIDFPHPCYINCKSQVKAALLQYTVDPNKELTIDIAIDSSNKVIGSLKVPSGALSNQGTFISIRPVADSLLRQTHNILPTSRYEDFGGKTSLSFHESLLSAAFECSTNSQNSSKFIVDLTFNAEIDYTRKPQVEDICLAYVFRIPELDYSRWKCVHGLPSNRRLYPVSEEGSAAPSKVSGVISDCQPETRIFQSPGRRLLNFDNEVLGKIYAFIHSPIPKPKVKPSEPKNLLLANLLPIIAVFLAVLVLLLISIFCMTRLYRYRTKYHEEKEQHILTMEKQEDLKQGVCSDTDDVELTNNPMALQVRDVQAELNQQNQKIKEEEEKQAQQNSDERVAHIQNLKEDRDQLNEKLKALQATLEEEQKFQQARKPIRQTNEDLSENTPSTVISSPASQLSSKKLDFNSPIKPKKRLL
eukprot:TRINITY_DN291_c0_g2_i2.p1 TRINITY_DN291_c0_g2~~TRINITY_DN291_c0_g2_i2.p1  ORF type:complete len:591 (-),score=89.16 TRINITY_DN291_c0_g2_i2:161-1933(-)